MLYIVLALVVAAFGLLVAALTTANTLFAWISVAVSVVAAVLLVTDWIGGRRRSASTPPAARPTVVTVGGQRSAGREPEPEPDLDAVYGAAPPRAEPVQRSEPDEGAEPDPFEQEEPVEQARRDEPADEPEAEPGYPDQEPDAPEPDQDDPGEPGEEPTDAADLLVVAGLDVEVRVVDEHPRYHLAKCGWLSGKATIPIAVSEARQLGFTPCARCGPDAALAARHRARR